MALIPPQPIGQLPGSSYWNDWIEKIRSIVNGTGSNTKHNDLLSIQGGTSTERYHLTSAQQTDLTDAGDSALHFHATDRNSANFTGTNWTDLTDAGDSTLHFHANDRARVNHTGTQTISTLSDLPTLAHGTYTPSLTNVTNLTGSTARKATWMRIGNTVSVGGQLDVDPTIGGACTLGISLPVASNFGTAYECGGDACAVGVAGQSAGIQADAANNRAEMDWIAVDITNQTMTYTFVYEVI